MILFPKALRDLLLLLVINANLLRVYLSPQAGTFGFRAHLVVDPLREFFLSIHRGSNRYARGMAGPGLLLSQSLRLVGSLCQLFTERAARQRSRMSLVKESQFQPPAS